MKLPSILGNRGARDKPKDSYGGSAYSFFFGRSTSGKNVNERTAMQTTAVYAKLFLIKLQQDGGTAPSRPCAVSCARLSRLQIPVERYTHSEISGMIIPD